MERRQDDVIAGLGCLKDIFIAWGWCVQGHKHRFLSLSFWLRKPANYRPRLGSLWEAARQSGEGCPWAAWHHHLSQTQGLCDPSGRDQDTHLPEGAAERLVVELAAAAPLSWVALPVLPGLPSVLCLLPTAGQPGLRVCIKREPSPEALLQGKSIYLHQRVWSTSLIHAKAAHGVFLDQPERACMLAVLCKWDSTTTPTLICSALTLAPGKNDPQGIALPIAPQRQVLKMSFR